MSNIFKFLQGNIKRLKSLNVKCLWDTYKKEEDVMTYFPNVFLKYPPPRKYFWKVIAVIKPDDFKGFVENELSKLKMKNVIKIDKLKATEEAISIFEAFNDETDIALLSRLISQKKRRSKESHKSHE